MRAFEKFEKRRFFQIFKIPSDRQLILAEVREFKDGKTQVDFQFDKFFFKYYFLLVFTLISINRKRKQFEILLRNCISKKFRQIKNQRRFFHPWFPGPLPCMKTSPLFGTFYIMLMRSSPILVSILQTSLERFQKVSQVENFELKTTWS